MNHWTKNQWNYHQGYSNPDLLIVMSKQMKILIIGGTEFFGRILVIKLLAAGHEVTLLTRGNQKLSEFWHKVSHIQCDRTDYSYFQKKLSHPTFDVVIDNVVFTQS